MTSSLPKTDSNKPCKVIVYRARLLPYSETFIKEQVRMLSRWRGVLAGDSRVRHGLALDGMDVRLLGVSNRILRKLGYLAEAFLPFPWRKVRALKREHADLVHIHFATDAFRIWPVVAQLNLPVLITLHGYDINTYKSWWESGKAGGGRQMRNFPAGLLRIAQDRRVHFIAVSHAIKERAIEFGIPGDKITVSYIGVDPTQFTVGPKPLADRREILYVGRLVEKKGCRYLLQAFSQIQQRFADYRLVIVGGGPLEPELRAFAQENDIRATFLGPLAAAQVRERLAEARVFCLPSITAENGDAEGLGIVVLEAQASGVPVITSARGGAKEGIVHGQTGFAHAEKDVAAIRDGLVALLSDDRLASDFGTRGRQHVLQKMDIGACIQQLEDIYEQHAFGKRPAAQAARMTCTSTPERQYT